MHNFLYWLGLLCFGLLERGQQATGQGVLRTNDWSVHNVFYKLAASGSFSCSDDKGQGGTARYDGALEILLIVKDKVSMKFRLAGQQMISRFEVLSNAKDERQAIISSDFTVAVESKDNLWPAHLARCCRSFARLNFTLGVASPALSSRVLTNAWATCGGKGLPLGCPQTVTHLRCSVPTVALLSKPVVAGDLPSVQIYSPEFTGAGSCMAPRVGEPRPVHLPSMIDTVNGLLAITARGSPSMLNYMKPDFFILHNAAKMQLELRGFSDSAMTFLARFRQYGTEQSWTDEEMKACCTVFSEMILKLGVSVQMFQWQDTLPDGIILTACFPNPAGPRNKACKPTAAFRPPARYPCLHPHRLFEMRTPPTIASS